MYYQIERKEAVMAKNLVIVESPSKATTIKKFLGSSYEVVASNGHVRDLPKSQLGIDIENGFEPKYITIRGKGGLLATLRKKVRKQIKYISQLTLTERVKRYHGICPKRLSLKIKIQAV